MPQFHTSAKSTDVPASASQLAYEVMRKFYEQSGDTALPEGEMILCEVRMPKPGGSGSYEKQPFAIQVFSLCVSRRDLAVTFYADTKRQTEVEHAYRTSVCLNVVGLVYASLVWAGTSLSVNIQDILGSGTLYEARNGHILQPSSPSGGGLYAPPPPPPLVFP